MERLHTMPYDGPPIDYDALRRDIREYIAHCRKHSLRPDAFTFSTGMVQRWSYVPGNAIQRMINEEEAQV